MQQGRKSPRYHPVFIALRKKRQNFPITEKPPPSLLKIGANSRGTTLHYTLNPSSVTWINAIFYLPACTLRRLSVPWTAIFPVLIIACIPLTRVTPMITSFILGTPGRAGTCFRIGSHHSRLSMTNLSDTFPVHSPWFLFVMSIIC